MNTYENISKELKLYFSSNPIFGLILHFDMFVVYGCVGLMIFNLFVPVGALVTSIAYYGFILGLLFCFANDNKKVLYRALFAYAGGELYFVLKCILQHYRYLNYSSLMGFLVFGGIGYLVLKKDSHIDLTSNNNNNNLPL